MTRQARKPRVPVNAHARTQLQCQTLPLTVEPSYQVRFISPNRTQELLNLYHTAKVSRNTKYDRMLLAVDWFCKKYPEYRSLAVYKDLDGLLAGV